MRHLLAGLVLALSLTVGFAAGWQVRESQPVGHARTEDSVVKGMDYRGGAWYTK